MGKMDNRTHSEVPRGAKVAEEEKNRLPAQEEETLRRLPLTTAAMIDSETETSAAAATAVTKYIASQEALVRTC